MNKKKLHCGGEEYIELYNDDIKEILTKEQYESRVYKC